MDDIFQLQKIENVLLLPHCLVIIRIQCIKAGFPTCPTPNGSLYYVRIKVYVGCL